MSRKKRSVNRRYRAARKEKLTFAPVIIILCLSVGCGYATAKYVVDPVVNYVPQAATVKGESAKSDIVEDEAEVKEKESVKGYALQFGCYSTENAAKSAMSTINITDLNVVLQDNMYKIIGEIHPNKEEAKIALDDIPGNVRAFITPIYE